MAVVSIAALLIITRLYLEAKDQTEQANKERGIAVEANAVAKREAEHSSAFKDYLLKDLLQIARPNRKGLKVTVKEALDIASNTIDDKFLKVNPELAAQLHDELGYTYSQLEQFDEAQKHQKRALELYLQAQGPDARATLLIRHNLFLNLVKLARWNEVDAEYDDLLNRMSRVLGESDPELLALLSTYATALEKRGKLHEAVDAYRKLATRYDNLTSPQSESSIITKANLANVLRSTDQHHEADLLMKDCLKRAKEELGPDHRLTLGLKANEALYYLQLRRFADAEPLLKEALESFQELYGLGSAPTLTLLNNLAGCYDGQGKFAEAIQLKKRVVEGRSKLFGPEHPDTLVVRSNLHCAEMDEALRRKVDSTKPYTDLQDLLKLRIKVSGADHHDTLLQAYTLGYFSNRRNDYAAAIGYFRQAMDGFRRIFGENHEMTMQSTMNLGGTYAKMKDHAQAEKVLRIAHDGVEKYKPKDHWLQGKVKSMLGQALAHQQMFGEAEPLLLKAYDIVKQNKQTSPEVMDMVLKNLAEYYSLRQLTTQADQWSARLKEHEKKTAHLR